MIHDVRAIRAQAGLPIAAPPVTATQGAPLVASASVAAKAGDQIDAAVSGDLIAASPVLAAKIADFETRIETLEGP